MRKLLLLLFFINSVLGLYSQDYLVVPSTNPSFFPKDLQTDRDKLLYQVDTVVYEYDSMQLPFIDDFTSDHFPPLIKDPANDPKVQSVLYHAILINGQVYSGEGFTGDPTYTYVISTSGDTISTSTNPVQLIQLYKLDVYPPQFSLENVYPPYDIVDTSSLGNDTLFREPSIIQDSIRYYVVQKDSTSYYLNRSVYRNFSMGFYPPSLGVATFDGLSEYGLPYNFNDIAPNGRADELTSVPIDLEATTDSTYFSFYFQAKGFALDGPEPEDSLSLEFYNSNSGRWGLVWQEEGISSTQPVDSFRQVILRVDSQFRTKGFQFRFRNRARLDGAYDNWHIDYIYLNDNRSINDTAKKDISFVYQATSMLQEYEAMPVWHFKTNPAAFMTDSVKLLVRNNFSGPLNVFNKIVFPDTINSVRYYVFPGLSQFLQIKPFGSLNLNYPVKENFTYPPSDIDSFQVMKGICDINFRPAPIEVKDFIRANDTTISAARLTSYYAYDDGTAEAGYGIENGSQGGTTANLAVRFDMPFQDTLGGVDMYFLPQSNDIRSQSFILTVWSSLSPATIIYQKEVSYKAIYDEKDAYISYFFDTLVLVGPTFYVGYQKIGARSMNLGYDLNKNHRDKIFFSLDGSNWFNPSPNIRDGSVMLRPVLRKKNFGVGLTEGVNRQKTAKASLVAFPNPVNNTFSLLEKPEGLQQLNLLSFEGRLIKEFDPTSSHYSISGLSNGMYLLHGIDRDGKVYTTKIIISQ